MRLLALLALVAFVGWVEEPTLEPAAFDWTIEELRRDCR